MIKTNRFSKLKQDLEKLTKEQKKLKEQIEKHLYPEGLDGSVQQEPYPNFNRATAEDVWSNKNSWIVLGKDRNASLKSISMATDSSMIDLVAGRASSHKPFGKKTGSSPGQNVTVDPNFFNDAARVYISQKTDIDSHFGLAPVSNDRSKDRSGVGIKADCVRIIGRNSIKIVTGKAIAKGGASGELNSQGGKMDGPGSISLIAGNYTEESTLPLSNFFRKVGNALTGRETKEVKVLQPIPKGDNLVECLRDIMDMIAKLSALIAENNNGLISLAGVVDLHFHDYGGGFGPTTPSSILAARVLPQHIRNFKALMQNFSKVFSEVAVDSDYFDEFSPLYINSRHVKTT